MRWRFQVHLIIFSAFLSIFLVGAYFYSQHLLASPSVVLDSQFCLFEDELKTFEGDCFQFKADNLPEGLIENIFLNLSFEITKEKKDVIEETPLEEIPSTEEVAPTEGVVGLVNLKLGIKILLAQVIETIGEIFQKDSFDFEKKSALEVAYRFSGLNDWQIIGYVDGAKSANLKIRLPIEPKPAMEELLNLQINIKKINLTDEFSFSSVKLEIEYSPIVEPESVIIVEEPKEFFQAQINEAVVKIEETKEAKIDMASLANFKLPEGSGELELYALPDRCLGSLEEIKHNLLTYPYCGDPIGFPISRPESYSWKLSEDAKIVIGACRSNQIDCGDEPGEFTIYFMSEEKLSANEQNDSIILKSVQGAI